MPKVMNQIQEPRIPLNGESGEWKGKAPFNYLFRPLPLRRFCANSCRIRFWSVGRSVVGAAPAFPPPSSPFSRPRRFKPSVTSRYSGQDISASKCNRNKNNNNNNNSGGGAPTTRSKEKSSESNKFNAITKDLRLVLFAERLGRLASHLANW